jgi:DNA-binding response OmpR family regulator
MAKILFIEDDLALQDTLKTKFSHHSLDVTLANDGESGLKKALSEKPDLIILDIRLPKMNGLTVMDKLRETPWGKTANIILLTNLEPDNDIIQSIMKDSPSYYLIKTNTSIDEVLEKAKDILKLT